MPFAALSASYFAHIGFFNPYLPLWLKDLGLGLVTISALMAVQPATRLFAPFVWGWLSDHTGERVKLMRISAAIALASACLLWLALPPLWLGVVLLVMFIHTSAMMPMSEAAMAHLVSQGGSFDARRYGRVRLWGSVGFLVTVLVAGAWFEAFGMRHFPTITVLGLLAVLVSVLRLPDLKETVHAGHVAVPLAQVLRRPAVRWFFVSAFLHVLSHVGIYAFFSLYLDSLGYSKTMIGAVWVVSVVVEVGWFYGQARWLPRLPLTGWMLLCSAAMALRMVITAGWGDVLVLLVCGQILHALSFAAYHTVSIALLSHHFPARLRGRGQALYAVIAYGCSGVLGGLVGGFMSEHWGLVSVFWACALSSLLAMAAGWQVWRHHHPSGHTA